jgi:hypothetical protein
VILYSIIPAEVIFGNCDKDYENKFVEVDYMGVKVQASMMENSKYVINRVISTSPKAYLNPKLQPGSIIERID